MAELVVDRVAAVEHRTLVSITVSIITAPKRSLGQGNVFTSVCHSVHRGSASRGGLHPGGSPSGGSASRGFALGGSASRGGLHPWDQILWDTVNK